VSAIVNNNAANAGVRWSVTCGSSSCGSFSATTTASGGTTTYTAPSAVPTGNNVTIIATSVTNSAQSASASMTITAVPPVILSDGTYVYNLSGQDGNGPSFVAGAFTVKGGLITGGEQDFSDPAYGRTDQLVTANCTLSSAGGNIQIVLTTSDPVVGVNGVETLRGTVVSNSRVVR
jgi:hypothetical protein